RRQLLGDAAPDLEPAVEEYLTLRPYPGNVRELRQLVTQIAVRYVGGGRVTVGMIPEAERLSRRPGVLDRLRDAVRCALNHGLDLRALKSAVADLAVEIALADSGGQGGPAPPRRGVTPRALPPRRGRGRAGAPRRPRGPRG